MDERHEISDLVVDYDPQTLARRPVRRSRVLETLRQQQNRWAVRVAAALPSRDDVLDAAHVDRVLVRSHLELQRLHEEFLMGERMRELLVPLVAALQRRWPGRPVRVVDLGCGLGYVLRWLAHEKALGDVVLVGADYNAAFTHAARVLAEREGLACRFVCANAFRLDEPATIYTSTGVLHHFTGEGLRDVFAEQARAGALAFVHFDIKPSAIAPIGSWIFHRARMREPLAQHDGYLSAVRAHRAARLVEAAREGAPAMRVALWDGAVGLSRLVRIMHALVGVHPEREGALVEALAGQARRLSRFEGA